MNWTVEDSPVGRVVVAPSVPPGRAIFYTTRDLEGRLSDTVIAELEAFVASRFRLDPSSFATCNQVHGVSVARGAGDGWRECDGCDALWSDERGVALGIKVADCLPVALVDERGPLAANIHAGWRGASAGVVDTTLAELRAAGFDPAQGSAWLGPSIRSCCFEVGEEVVASFLSSDPRAERFADRSRGDRPFFDVAGYVTGRLLDAGFSPHSIHDSGLCTRCESSIFHSYRRDGERAGRNLAWLVQ
jgi:polyphenol oxidase